MPSAARPLLRTLIAALVALAAGAGAARAQSPEAPPEALVWTDAPLAEALYDFTEASGVEVVFALRLVREVRVSGTYTVDEPPGPALDALLAGTGLRAERVRRGQYVLIAVPLNVPVAGDDPSFYTGALEGRVVDAETGEPLFGAHVWLVDLDLGDVVDASGAFAVENLPTGTYSVRVSHIGYRAVRVELDVFPASPQLPPTVRLRPEAIRSEAATVRPSPLPPEPEPGLAILSPFDVPGEGQPTLAITGPVLGGDLLGGLSLVPGVSRTDGASGPLTIRGAEPGRALVVRDGVPIYGAGALGASFQPEALQAARLHSGPLPVELDGSAGVIELETRSPGTAAAGTLVAGLGGFRGVVSAPLAPGLGVQAGWGRPAPADLPLASARTTGGALVVDPRGRSGAAEADSRDVGRRGEADVDAAPGAVHRGRRVQQRRDAGHGARRPPLARPRPQRRRQRALPGPARAEDVRDRRGLRDPRQPARRRWTTSTRAPTSERWACVRRWTTPSRWSTRFGSASTSPRGARIRSRARAAARG